MAMVRNEKLVPMVEEKQIDWLAPNGNWQIIGKIMPDPMDSSFPRRSINIYRYDKQHRKMMRFDLGLESKKMPSYVLEKYNEIQNEIRERGQG